MNVSEVKTNQISTLVGTVTFFARSSAPTGWLKCNGAAIGRTDYEDLFDSIGTTYGTGDGSTTFNLPDLRGEFVRCWDDGRGVDSGRSLTSTSFADIFFNNCFKNGILPIVVSKEQLDQLMDDANNGANSILDIDLENQQIGRPNGDKINFQIDEFRKHCLINGLDDIGLTMQKQDSIGDFEKRREIEQPWV